MKRFLLATTLLVSSPAMATTYYPIFDAPQIGYLAGPCYCDGGPIFGWEAFPTYARAGDFLDYGTVTIQSVFDGHSFDRMLSYWDMIAFLSYPLEIQQTMMQRTNFQGTLQINRNQNDPNFPQWPLGYMYAPLGSSISFQLLFLVDGPNEGFQLASSGPLSITPGIAAAVPEPASWVLMIAGFLGIGGFSMLRKRDAIKAALATSELVDG